jgi:hypothetical protein
LFKAFGAPAGVVAVVEELIEEVEEVEEVEEFVVELETAIVLPSLVWVSLSS